jgi:phosphoketolase
MGNVSVTCEARINSVVNSHGQELQNQAIRGLYGYESCCNHLQEVFKVTLLKAIVDRYNDLDAEGQVLEVINEKQAECYCNWIQRHTPNENPVNP